MFRRGAACKRFAAGKTLRPDEFISSVPKVKSWGPRQTCLMGKQVRIPISELKNYLREKLAY